MVFEPTRSPAVFRATGIPSTLIWESPGLNVVFIIATAVEPAVMTWSAVVVVIAYGSPDARNMVFEPSISWPDLSRATSVLPVVTPESPGSIVVPAIAIAVGAAVMAPSPLQGQS